MVQNFSYEEVVAIQKKKSINSVHKDQKLFVLFLNTLQRLNNHVSFVPINLMRASQSEGIVWRAMHRGVGGGVDFQLVSFLLHLV